MPFGFPITIPTLGTLFALTFVLFLLVRQPRRELRSGSLTLLRCLFPAWRFFEEIAAVPQLSHRSLGPSGVAGPWVQTLQPPRRHAGMWGLHAAGNLFLAYQSLVEQLASELLEDKQPKDPTQSVSYQLVQALIVRELRGAETANLPVPEGHYQFRLSDGHSPDALWISPVHGL
jgi:hypothetical protein